MRGLECNRDRAIMLCVEPAEQRPPVILPTLPGPGQRSSAPLHGFRKWQPILNIPMASKIAFLFPVRPARPCPDQPPALRAGTIPSASPSLRCALSSNALLTVNRLPVADALGQPTAVIALCAATPLWCWTVRARLIRRRSLRYLWLKRARLTHLPRGKWRRQVASRCDAAHPAGRRWLGNE